MVVSLLFIYTSNTMGCIKLNKNKALNVPGHIIFSAEFLCFLLLQS
jgi:hypothetical protein